MTIFEAIILGIVEGITEFLPVSSTAHLLLAGEFFRITSTSFTKSFDIAIQFGAILAVVFLYWKKIISDKEIWKKVLVAVLPTVIIGFLFYKVLKEFLLSNVSITLSALFLGGVALIIFEKWHSLGSHKSKEVIANKQIGVKESFLIGVMQSIAIIPGVSRSGATIVGGLMMGIKRKDIVEFSFLLAIPTMALATTYDLYKSAGDFSFSEINVLAVGFVISFVVAIFAIKWLLKFIENHNFISFGIYRIFLSLLFWIFIVN